MAQATQSYTQTSQNIYSFYTPQSKPSSPPETTKSRQHSQQPQQPQSYPTSSQLNEAQADAKSQVSSRSGARSRGSAVLARAREYNRIIDENRTRSKSYDRKAANIEEEEMSANANGRRSVSAPRSPKKRSNSRDRAMQSVRMSSSGGLAHHHQQQQQQQYNGSGNGSPNSKSTSSNAIHRAEQAARDAIHSQNHHHNPTSANAPSSTQRSSPNKISPTNSQTRSKSSPSASPRSNQTKPSPQSQSQSPPQPQPSPTTPNEDAAIVTPELLVDALSGHEDGLLAIAERLMEHYDSGYDAMGEAIIDAFADVQKLFQHVVEAAHMEGAAYEAGRREEEIERLKRIIDEGNLGGLSPDYNAPGPGGGNGNVDATEGGSGAGPTRHDEFIDQDVRDVLLDAIRKGQALKEAGKHAECYTLYEQSCNSASALLPVDSDHRGRLQLSIARAESMSPERSCAILKYVMDDVLRSGLNANSKVVMPDPSKRGDCVLTRPPPKSRSDDYSVNSKFSGGQSNSAGDGVVLQSSEEALASLVEEMKEVMSAPVYDSTPLQSVAQRFWVALGEAQRSNLKNEERLEQKLGTLKGEFLLAREEWEDKFNALSKDCNTYKKKIERLKEVRYMETARTGMSRLSSECGENDLDFDNEDSQFGSPRNRGSSVASFGSLAHHARNIVGTFSCTGTDHSSMNKDSRERRGKSRNSSSRVRDLSPPPSVASSSFSQSKSSSRKTSLSGSNYTPRTPSSRISRKTSEI